MSGWGRHRATASPSSFTTSVPAAPRPTSAWRRSSCSMKHKALGKGLRSLIPEAPVRSSPPPSPVAATQPPPGERLHMLDLDLIRPNPRQPRQDFDESALEALAGSLKDDGVLQPIVVRPVEAGRYEIVAGERRWRAAQRAGL